MSLPLIGITTSRASNKAGHPTLTVMEAYIQSVQQAGAAPLMIPLGLPEEQLDTICERVDGILFTGGGDVAPEIFQGEEHPKVTLVDPDRDRVEIHLVQRATQKGQPFLGICRGLQVINVALGGSLYTHLPEQFPHAIKHDYDSGTERKMLAHDAHLQEGTRLAQILGAVSVPVNSLHHQGIRELAPGLKAIGHAPDGLVEAIELTGHPFGMAVQWHPEWLQEHTPMRALFRAFTQAAGNGHAS